MNKLLFMQRENYGMILSGYGKKLKFNSKAA